MRVNNCQVTPSALGTLMLGVGPFEGSGLAGSTRAFQ